MPNQIAWGFHQLQDIFDERIRNIDVAVLNTAIETSAAAYTEDLNAMLAGMVERTTTFKERIALPSGGELQPLSQNGTPLVTRTAGRYDVAYPLMRAGDSFGANRETYAKMTVGEMNRRMVNVQIKDARWNIRRLLAAIFTNAAWTFDDEDSQVGALTIRPAATTADGAIFLDLNGDLATFEHYTAQAAAIDNANNPYAALYSLLYSHPENIEPFVAYVPPDLVAATQALAAFHPYAGATPFVNYVNTTLADDAVGGLLGFGNRVLGEANGMVIVESRRIPAGYIVGQAAGSGPVLKMREEPELSLQGLQMVEIQVDSNFRRWDFYRKAGFGISNPVGVAVRRIGNASYAIPTGYNAAQLTG